MRHSFTIFLLSLFILPAASAANTTLISLTNIPKPSTHMETNEQMCMAHIIYHEARGESLYGQIAVASVALNRANATRWADTICGVGKWKKAFSFVDVDTHAVPTVNEPEEWAKAWILAGLIKTTPKEFIALDHYHTDTVNPSWNQAMILKEKIGSHLFYKDPTTQYANANITLPAPKPST